MLELLDLRDGGERLEPRRLEIDPSLADSVRAIVERVRAEGDGCLVELARRLDGADVTDRGLVVSAEELDRSSEEIPPGLRRALDRLVERLAELHVRQLPREWWDERDGVLSGEIVRAIRAVGCYVPGGRAEYPSSVAMTVVPAAVAGVEEIVVASPPRPDGTLPPAVLYAARRAGATRVVRMGGAQAIAALAFGTASVPTVDRIVGPGNAYVTEAKRQVSGLVGVDGLAGPSELTIVADASAEPRLVALDLVAQAEHDPDAVATLVATAPDVVDRVRSRLPADVAASPRRSIVERALRGSRAVLVADARQAAEIVNDLAPEHLEVLLDEPRTFLGSVRNAGAIFLGRWTAVPFGDYGVASNHVLPTAATARFTSGLRAADFVTVTAVVELDGAAARRLAPEVAEMARAEALEGHAATVEARAAPPEEP